MHRWRSSAVHCILSLVLIVAQLLPQFSAPLSPSSAVAATLHQEQPPPEPPDAPPQEITIGDPPPTEPSTVAPAPEVTPITGNNLDGLFAVQQPDIVPVEVGTLAETTPVAVPENLSLEASHYLPSIGEMIEFSLRIERAPGSPSEGLRLQFEFPSNLQIVSTSLAGVEPTENGLLVWQLPALEGDAPFVVTVAAKLLAGAPGIANKVRAHLTKEGYASRTADLLIGMADASAEFVVLLDPETVANGVSAATVLVDAVEISVTEAPSETTNSQPTLSPVSTPFRVLLPLIFGNSNAQTEGESPTQPEAPSQETVSQMDKLAVNDGLRYYKIWNVEALQGASVVEQLDRPATIIISAKKLLELGLEPGGLGIWTRSSPDLPWQPTNYWYDEAHQLYILRTKHFSDWGLGSGLQSVGNLLPSMRSFSSDRFTGNAGVSYAIEAPAGLGGMTPGLALNYSSAAANDLKNDANGNTHVYNVQADWGGGLGWSLSGVSYIAKRPNVAGDAYFLVLNGISYELKKISYDQWRTEPESFIRVTHAITVFNQDSNPVTPDWIDVGPWEVEMGDGTRYSFGSIGFNANGEPMGPDGVPWEHNQPERRAAWTSLLFNNRPGNTGTDKIGSKWYLRQVVDALGNRMEYEYGGEIDRVGTFDSSDGTIRNCTFSFGYDNNSNYYQRAVYLQEVRWSVNANQNVTPKLRIRLESEGRNDYQIYRWDTGLPNDDPESGRCAQPMFNTKRLSKIWVETLRVNTTNQWDVLRAYKLNYNAATGDFGPNRHSMVVSLQQFGKDATPSGSTISGSQINTYTFGYGGSNNNIVMGWADNGLGGRITYDYEEEAINCTACPTIYYSRRVNLQIITDTLGNSYRTTYAYQGPKGIFSNVSGFDFLGNATAQATTFAPNSTSLTTTEKYEQFWFHQWLSSSTADPRKGKTYLYQISQSPGGALLQKSETNWEAVDQGGGRNWVRQNQVDNYTWGFSPTTMTATVGFSNTTKFFYDPAKQGGTQYGNATLQEEWAGAQLLRKSETEFFPNITTGYVVNAPARQRILDPSNNCVAESRTIYYDPAQPNGNQGANYTASPVTTLPAKTVQALATCATNSDAIADNNHAWSIAKFDYDGVGNQTKQTVLGDDTIADDVTQNEYDPFYRLFPTRRWKSFNSTNYEEKAAYFGVTTLPNGAPNDAWGLMAQFCGVNQVCIRQRHDTFGRPLHRWEGLTITDTWPSDNNSNVQYDYFTYGGAQSTNTILEWKQPRSEGNFTRKLYNGLGQLIQEQAPTYNWAMETIIDHAYDTSGREIKTSVPYSVSVYSGTPANSDIRRPANWSYGASTSQYDAIDRPIKLVSPSNQQTWNFYAERKTAVVGLATSNLSTDDKVLNWTELDALGNLRSVRNYNNLGLVGGVVTFGEAGVVTLTHDLKGNLTCVYHATAGPNGASDPCAGSPDPRTVTKVSYDLAGRKTQMQDPDMGTWTYSYNRLNLLQRQTDALNQATCLYYEGLQRLEHKFYSSGTFCPQPGAIPISYDLTYDYDAGHTPTGNVRSLGQVTSLAYNDGRWGKTLTYDGRGLLASEAISISGAVRSYTTNYQYDQWSRPITTTMPDGEAIAVEYNGAGLQKSLFSTMAGPLIDNATYDEAGRLTQLRMPAGSTIWRHQSYHPWTTADGNNGGLASILVSDSTNPSAPTAKKVINLRDYTYDKFGNINSYQTGLRSPVGVVSNRWHHFKYDWQNRLTVGDTTSAPGSNPPAVNSYNYDVSGRLTSYQGVNLTTPNPGPIHAIYPVTNTYQYDANGNVKVRGNQILTWSVENRLAALSGTGVNESYVYDPDGKRVKKTSNGLDTFYIGDHFEVTQTLIARSAYITDFVWYDDAFPLSTTTTAVPTAWPWQTSSTPPVVSGSKLMASPVLSNLGNNQFGRTSVTINNGLSYATYQPFQVNAGDILYFHAYFDSGGNRPNGLFVSWAWPTKDPFAPSEPTDQTQGRWVQWGNAVSPGWGSLGDVPASGVWHRLEITAANYGIAGAGLVGMEFRLSNGRVYIDKVGKRRPEAPGTGPVLLEYFTKYYFFNGQRIGVGRTDNNNSRPSFTYLHTDHLGSVVSGTDPAMNVKGDKRYYSYGRTLTLEGAMPTDHDYTGQKMDASGLVYMSARYYDPQIGAFISPDPLIPNARNLFDYNRYMYVRGNPMKHTDSSGHFIDTVFDAISIGYGVYDIYQNGLNWENGLSLAADVASLAIPFVAGGGLAVRAIVHADDVVDAIKRSDEVFTVASHADEAFAAASHVDEVGDIGKQADNFNPPCKRNSFTPETYVWTANGFEPISTVDVDDLVYAYNEATRTTGLYTVTATISHLDPVVWTVIINGERVDTTPEHPFYADGRWVDAADLRVGDDVRRADGSTGEVQRIEITQRPQVMYNLSVAEAHTFFVGQQQWLVHNCGEKLRDQYLGDTPGKKSRTGKEVIKRMEGEGLIRQGDEGKEVFHSQAGWVDIAKTDMGHTTDAVSWWNSTGRNFGAKAKEVRKWMLDPNNYKLEPYWINRSNGAKLSATYLPPVPKD